MDKSVPQHAALLAIEDGDIDDEAALEAALARLPAPRSPELMFEKLRALGVEPGDVVIDLGCGHGQYARQIVSGTGAAVVAFDLSAKRVTETRDALQDVAPGRSLAARAVAEALPLSDRSAKFIWCRDMLNLVDLPATLNGCARALAHGGYMLVYQTFATDLLEPREARRIYEAFALVARNMDRRYFESCARHAGFDVVEHDPIWAEWREGWEADGSRKTSAALLRAALLTRGSEPLQAQLGPRSYEFAVADHLWGIYQMIGKLCPTIYVLRRS